MNQTQLKADIEQFLEVETKKLIPQLSIDCVIFSFHEMQLKVLLLEGMGPPTMAGLPSGFVYQDEDIDKAALRNLKERTGLDQLFLQQFHAFGKANRRFSEEFIDKLAQLGMDIDKANWFFQRFVTIGYYALVDFEATQPQPNLFSEIPFWANVHDLPTLIIDHAHLVRKAMSTLKKDILTQPIGLKLLPTEFTIPQLHTLYEIILQRPIDRRNFRKKMLAANVLVPLNQQQPVKGHRMPNLYRFNKKEYKMTLSGEVKMGF
ncbi:MAG: NUDIX domain-containing protein [Bacteroidota bacterium]